MEAYFSGKKNLFKGLAIEQLEQEWTVYPVLHIDFSRTKYTAIEDLQEQLNLYLSGWERIYGKNEEETSYAARLTGLLQRIYQQTGKQAVVLMHLYWIVIVTLLYKDNCELKCGSSSVLSKPKGNTFVFYF